MDGSSRSQIEYLISEWVLNQRDRDIMRRRLIDGNNVRPQGNSYDRDGHSYASRDDRGRYSTHNEHRPDDLMDEFQRLMDRYR